MNKRSSSRQNTWSGGYVMLLNTVLFIGIALAVIIGAGNPVISHYSSAYGMLSSKQSYLVGHSAAEDAFYRIKRGITLPASSVLSLSSGSATITTADSGGEKTVTVGSDNNNYQRNLQLKIGTGSGIDFNYGLQAGNGGLTMGGGSEIIGNVYSNGSINAVSSVITGTAVAADSAPLGADQTNNSPIPSPSSINFRNASASRDFAQSFQVSDTSPLNKVQFYIKKTGSPANATVLITTDNSGSPNSSSLSSATLNAGLITGSYGWAEVLFTTKPSLIPGVTYWVVIQNGSQHASNYYTIAANDTYTDGLAKTGKVGGSWTTTSLDGYFQLYTGGVSSFIGGASYATGLFVGNSTSLIGDAWAGIVKGTTAYGNLYCTDTVNSTNNSKACNTSKGIPPSEPLPFSDANIEAWKDSADDDIALGDTTVGWAGLTLGPDKIVGNLTVEGGGTLTLEGPLWVTGNVSITGGGSVEIPADYGKNSEVIIADGRINVNGGGSAGSGQAGSYLFMVSTSKCPNDIDCDGNSAISISGGAGAIAANAQSGNVALSGGAEINAVVGNSITVTGGSTVTYDAGLASPSFNSGPSGGYTLIDWIEI